MSSPREQEDVFTKLKAMLGAGTANPSIEDILETSSKAAAIYSSHAESLEFKEEDCFGNDTSKGDDTFDRHKRKNILTLRKVAEFFFSLAKTKLQMARVPTEAGAEPDWQDVDTETARQFLPDTQEFQLAAPADLLWTTGETNERPKPLFGRNEAYDSLDCDLEDKGDDVLWRLDVSIMGFPLAGEDEGNICILREHHRQVMYVAFAWLLKNSVTLALTSRNLAVPPPATVASVCGSSGIGKSRSLIFLMWHLLQEKCAFLLERGSKRPQPYVLVRPRESTVKFFSQFDDVMEIAMWDRSIVCVVDPDHSQQGTDPTLSPLLGQRGPTILTPPSADPKHVPRADKEDHRVRRFWVSPWPKRLLEVVRPYFSEEDISQEEISSRFDQVGGIPRAIFKRSSFHDRMATITTVNILDTVDVVFEALIQDIDYEKMMKKVPQAFLAYYSRYPFTYEVQEDGKNFWVDFLSLDGRNRYGNYLYKKLLRSGLSVKYDSSSAGMFFERWVGSFLSGGKGKFMDNSFALREYIDGVASDESIVMPCSGEVTRFTDEELLLESLTDGVDHEMTDDTDAGTRDEKTVMFPRAKVLEAPRGTPVYDFAITKKWMVNATIAQTHPLTIASVKKLVARVKATKDDPLHLVFFVLDEKLAKTYSMRRDGETYQGEDVVLDINVEQVQALKENAVGAYSADQLRKVALGLGVSTEGMKKRRRNDPKLTANPEVVPLPPYRLIDLVMKKLLLNVSGKLEEKWGRLVAFVKELSDDGRQGGEAFDRQCVKQHVITLIPLSSTNTDGSTSS